MDNMTNYEFEVKLIDKNGKYFEVEFGYSYLKGNKESYFSVSTQNGQEEFEPATDAQERLLELWQKYHLKGVIELTDIVTTDLLDDIYEALRDEWETRVTVDTMPVQVLSDYLSENTDFDSVEIPYVIAIARHCQCTLDEIEDITIDGNDVTCQGRDYLVCTDDEADELEREYVENLIEECYLFEYRNNKMYDTIIRYLDLDKWIDDWCGNRGENLNHYDGTEYEEYVVDEWYYIYRR